MKPLIRALLFSLIIVSVRAAGADPGAKTPPSAILTWNQIALEAVARAKTTQHQAIRLLTYVSLAQYATLAEADNEHAAADAVATASMRVIAGLIPAQAAFVEERHRQLQTQAIDERRKVAERVLAQANRDGFAQPWHGQAPQGEYTWRSLANPPAPPAYPALGSMRTFFITAGNVFRSAPPPAPNSARYQADLAEVRRHTEAPTAESARLAKFYDKTTGTLAAGFWNEQATAFIRKNAVGGLQAARILTTMNAAMMDAIVACHDTKYTYWVPRPSQADPSIKPLIGVPNHPAYASNHSCLSTAAALVLAHFFPMEKGKLESIAVEAGVSRIYAGLHYRFDVDAGEVIGRHVASVAIARHDDVLARWTPTLVSGY
jgi:hypothetical protein